MAIIGLTVPAIALSVCAIFLCFWYYNRQDRAALAFASAFALCAVGFSLNHFFLPKESLTNAVVHNACYAAGLYLLVSGIYTAFDRRPPAAMLIALGVASVISAGLIQALSDGLSMRITVINMIHGIMLVVGLFGLWGIWRVNWTGGAVFAATSFCLLNFMVISPLTVISRNITSINFFQSAYWEAMNVLSTFSVLAMGGALIAVCVMQRVRAVQEDADRDYLTGLKTRRAFEEAARDYCASRSGKVAASMVIIDIDHFKTINDRHGHAAGDAVLAAFGALLTSQTRKSDIGGRIGGEEFCLLLPGTDTTGARQLAVRLKNRLASLTCNGLPESDKVTASFGVAELGATSAFADVYPQADAALYAAKMRGRDRVVCAVPPDDAGQPVRREIYPVGSAARSADPSRMAS